MDNPRQTRRSLGIVAGIAAVVLVAGGAATWWTRNNTNPDTSTVTNPSQVTPDSPPDAPPSEAPTPDETTQAPDAPTVEKTLQAYFLRDAGTSFELVPVDVTVNTSSDEPDAILTAAFARLLDTPEQNNAFNTIPPETQLKDLSVRNDGIHINLSQEFTSGGGSASMMGRLGQVVYTATSLDPDASVWLSVDGQPLTLLGGEGLEIPQPISRQQFDSEFSL
ncbi:GerMN domain-containing protein [Baaleninema sp.]|uniref:GerMN domain-containing protein n=1 Tax=Baaleninema sp. TaxID=3101197 RepID=UPI003D02ADB1